MNMFKKSLPGLLIDYKDYHLLKYSWNINYKGYVVRTKRIGYKTTTVMLAREILSPPKNLQVDHINGNKLDNRRCNLRICTQFENMQNRYKAFKNSITGIRGVAWDNKNKKYIANIQIEHKRIKKYFSDLEKAKEYVIILRKTYMPFSEMDKN